MLQSLSRLAPALRLTRITTTFAAVANIWFVILWTRATRDEAASELMRQDPVLLQIGGGLLVAIGLYSFAAAGNDLLDIRRDRALRPERPLASGALSTGAALAVITFSLLAAVLGASALGIWSVRLMLVAVGAILFYNLAGRHFPSVRVVLLGLIYALHMFIANPELGFVWPVWLVMTHSLSVSAMTHVLAGGRPLLKKAAIASATVGWLFWSTMLLGLGWWRTGSLWPAWANPLGAVLAGVLVLVFIFLVWRIVRRGHSRAAADRVMKLGAFWLALYSGAWLLGQGHVKEGIGLTLVAVGGFAGAILLHELAMRLEHPLDYRL